MHEEMREQLRNRVLDIPKEKRPKELQEIAEWQPLSKSKKNKISRYFDEKLKYLSGRKSLLDSHFVAPLKHLHKYRNEAHHRAKVRRESIVTACRILLDINCEMLLCLLPSTTSYSSEDDYSWFRERFCVGPGYSFVGHDFVRQAVEDIRSRVTLNDQSIAQTLAKHIDSRIEDLIDALDFIAENIHTCAGREAALKHSQYWGEVQRGKIDPSLCPIERFKPRFSLDSIERLKKQISELTRAGNRLEAFERFSDLESELESFEDDVYEIAAGVDYRIQMEIDQYLGK